MSLGSWDWVVAVGKGKTGNGRLLLYWYARLGSKHWWTKKVVTLLYSGGSFLLNFEFLNVTINEIKA